MDLMSDHLTLGPCNFFYCNENLEPTLPSSSVCLKRGSYSRHLVMLCGHEIRGYRTLPKLLVSCPLFGNTVTRRTERIYGTASNEAACTLSTGHRHIRSFSLLVDINSAFFLLDCCPTGLLLRAYGRVHRKAGRTNGKASLASALCASGLSAPSDSDLWLCHCTVLAFSSFLQ